MKLTQDITLSSNQNLYNVSRKMAKLMDQSHKIYLLSAHENVPRGMNDLVVIKTLMRPIMEPIVFATEKQDTNENILESLEHLGNFRMHLLYMNSDTKKPFTIDGHVSMEMLDQPPSVADESGDPFGDPFQDMGSDMGMNISMDVPETPKADLSFAADFAEEEEQINATPRAQKGVTIFPTPVRQESSIEEAEGNKDEISSSSQKLSPVKPSAMTKIAASWIKEKVKELNESMTLSELTQSVTLFLPSSKIYLFETKNVETIIDEEERCDSILF
jgi:hypothetical protein